MIRNIFRILNISKKKNHKNHREFQTNSKPARDNRYIETFTFHGVICGRHKCRESSLRFFVRGEKTSSVCLSFGAQWLILIGSFYTWKMESRKEHSFQTKDTMKRGNDTLPHKNRKHPLFNSFYLVQSRKPPTDLSRSKSILINQVFVIRVFERISSSVFLSLCNIWLESTQNFDKNTAFPNIYLKQKKFFSLSIYTISRILKMEIKIDKEKIVVYINI